jgi:hypothetical protein
MGPFETIDLNAPEGAEDYFQVRGCNPLKWCGTNHMQLPQ